MRRVVSVSDIATRVAEVGTCKRKVSDSESVTGDLERSVQWVVHVRVFAWRLWTNQGPDPRAYHGYSTALCPSRTRMPIWADCLAIRRRSAFTLGNSTWTDQREIEKRLLSRDLQHCQSGAVYSAVAAQEEGPGRLAAHSTCPSQTAT